MSNCVLGPNEAGVFFTQICYELLRDIQFEKNFDIKLWLSRLDKPFQLDTLGLSLRTKWKQFLNEAPLADVIQWKLKHYPSISTLVGLLNILSNNYILIKTTICLTTQIMEINFEKNLYSEFLQLINSTNPNLLEWLEKVQDLHVAYQNTGKPRNWKQIVKERCTKDFRKELKQEIKYVPSQYEDEEINIILRNIYQKMNFVEKPLQFLSYYTNILDKNELKRLIIAATYLDENMLYKISQIKTTSQMLNKNLEIFFKLMNYKHRFEFNEEYWKAWLKEEYLKQTHYDLSNQEILNKHIELLAKQREMEKGIKSTNITYTLKLKETKHEWINIKNVQQMLIDHYNYMNKQWKDEEDIKEGDNEK